MSTRTSHRRRARRQRAEVQKRVVLMTDIPNWEHMEIGTLNAILDARNDKENQSVPCEHCGWPSLSYECFTECRDSQGRRIAFVTEGSSK